MSEELDMSASETDRDFGRSARQGERAPWIRRRAGPIASTVVSMALVLVAPAADAATPRPVAYETGAPTRHRVGSVEDRYELPVKARVVDRFREPPSEWGAGNRGWEFATRGGEPVVAVGAGSVAYAGFVAGRYAVSIDHGEGLVSSVTGLAHVTVTQGQSVHSGDHLGVAMARLHLGFRLHGRYIDPAPFFERPTHAVLVPLPSRTGN